MPYNPERVKLLIESENGPFDFQGRLEATFRAKDLARQHLAKVNHQGRPTLTGDVLHLIYRALHPLVHEWVKVLVYDPSTDRIFDPGAGRVVCYNCDWR